MNITSVKIVADSSANLMTMDGVAFSPAPLKIITTEKEYTDDASLDVSAMVDELARYKGRSSSSCPNCEDWLNAFGDAQYVFCATITSGLSGSYNSAMMAKQTYESEHPDRKVFVLDSLSAGPEITLSVEKMRELTMQGLEFDEIAKEMQNYIKTTGLLFSLESMKNFANNGRVSPFVAKAAGLLGIRVVGKASDEGTLQPLHKCRGEERALKTIIDELEAHGLKSGRVIIAHSFNLSAAEKLKSMITEHFGTTDIKITENLGLCSFYAEKGGLLVGFEKQ